MESVIAKTIEMQSCIDELNILRKEFEVCKMELNYQKARKQKIEAFVRRDTYDNCTLSHNWTTLNGQVSISNLQQIYEGEW